MQPAHRLMTTAIFAIATVSGWLTGTAGALASEPMKTGGVEIYGNKKVKTYVIRREISLRRGEPYDKTKVDRARRRISKIPGVDYSEIRVSYTPIDTSLSLTVIVTEKPALKGFPIIRRGPENLISFGAWIAEYNFRGRSETIGAYFAARGGTVVGAFWENPWLGSGPRIGLGLDLHYADYRYPYDDLGGGFEGEKIRRGGGALSVFYTLGHDFRPFVTAGYEWVDGGGEVTIDPGGDRFATVAMGLRQDARGSRSFPWSGWYFLVEAKGYGPGDEAYNILGVTVDARMFVPVFDRVVLGAHGAAHVKEGDRVPVYLREHLGGGLTIRGYDYGTFNGTSSVASGAELRIPINFSRQRTVEDLLFAASIHLFADAGAAWELEQTQARDMWHGGFGAGILLMSSAFRGLRFDYGWNADSEGRFHFEIGAKF